METQKNEVWFFMELNALMLINALLWWVSVGRYYFAHPSHFAMFILLVNMLAILSFFIRKKFQKIVFISGALPACIIFLDAILYGHTKIFEKDSAMLFIEGYVWFWFIHGGAALLIGSMLWSRLLSQVQTYRRNKILNH